MQLTSSKRQRNEKIYWDNSIKRKYSGVSEYRLTNNLKYQELFSKTLQFQHIVPFWGDIIGKKILDLACGTGWTSIYFARSGAKAYCCDISPQSIAVAKNFTSANGVAQRMMPCVMPAEHLAFPAKFFDLVFMNAGLHHCDVNRVSREIYRVLKPGGKASLVEDLAYHPLFKLYRILTPAGHSPNEAPLKMREVLNFVKPFSCYQLSHYQLLDIFNRNGISFSIFTKMDHFLLKNFKFLRKYSRLIGIDVVK